jgi:hypothetical protein
MLESKGGWLTLWNLNLSLPLPVVPKTARANKDCSSCNDNGIEKVPLPVGEENDIPSIGSYVQGCYVHCHRTPSLVNANEKDVVEYRGVSGNVAVSC